MTRARRGTAAPATVLLALVVTQPAAAQAIDGSIAVTADVLPRVDDESGRSRAFGELRLKLSAEKVLDLGTHVRVTLAGLAEGLTGSRGEAGTVTAATLQPRELQLEARWSHADLRVGMSRIVWGRLDEIQPTDVVNPLDLTRFFFEGRSEARRAVALARARWLPSERVTLEALYVPWFRPGRFDELDAATSAFNLAPLTTCAAGAAPPCAPLARTVDQPPKDWSSAQGGLRSSVTTGRIDWSVMAYRGYESLPLYDVMRPTSFRPVPAIVERYPRFTMVGGDFETVRGEWGVRGEIAAYPDRRLQGRVQARLFDGHTIEGGVGADRSAGAYRVSGNIVVARRWLSDRGGTDAADRVIDRTDVNLVGAVDRSFVRETRRIRVFGVYNPEEASAFVRAIAGFDVRDNVAIEASGGVFAGDGADALSRLASRDFVYLRLKVFF